MYLTFAEYQAWGGKLNELGFNRAEFMARMKINALTHNRLENEDPVREVVKRLVFELIERGYTGALDGVEIASQREGGLSATFASKERKAEELIELFLGDEVSIGGGIEVINVVRV